MNDPVLRVLITRQALADEGYSRSLLISGSAHATAFFVLLILAFLTPPQRLINVIDGFAVPLPRGGGIPRAVEPSPSEPAPESVAAPPQAEPQPPAPARLIRPETVPIKKGLAPVDRKRSAREPRKPESREIAREKIAATSPPPSASAPAPGAATAASGLDFSAQTPGVINGSTGPTGALGFYLAAAQNKIWATWARQIRPNLATNVKVSFTIHRDGSVADVEVIESSGSATLDRLAERAVLSTQLGPLPNAYEKETLVVHANFKPTS